MSSRARHRIRALGASLGLALLLAVLVLGVAHYYPLPLGVLRQDIEARINRALAPLHLEIEEVGARWGGDGTPSLQLLATRLSLYDQLGRPLGAAPSGQVRLALGPLLQGRAEITAVRLEGPSFGVIRGPEGHLSLGFDGAGAPLADLLRPFLGGLAEPADMLSPDSGSSPPRLEIAQGSMTYEDAASRLRLRIVDLESSYLPDADPPRIDGSLALLVAGQRLAFSASLQEEDAGAAAGDGLRLSVVPHQVRPAMLAEALPGGELLSFVEFPVSGKLALRFDRGRSLRMVAFDLIGGPGSLEVADFNARNLTVTGARFHGSYDAGERLLRLTLGRLELASGSLSVFGTVEGRGEALLVDLEARLLGGGLPELMPRWFAGLSYLESGPEPGARTSLTLRGRILPGSGEIDALGTIRIGPPDGEDGKGAGKALDFVIDGPLTAPRLMIAAANP